MILLWLIVWVLEGTPRLVAWNIWLVTFIIALVLL